MRFRYPLALAPLCFAAPLHVPALRAADSATAPGSVAATGTIVGRVFNASTQEYLSAAEVRVSGTSLVAITESDGTYRLAGVPAGLATLTVRYTGTRADPISLQVSPGATATRDIEVRSSSDATAAAEVLKLGAFVVSTEREGNAKAIMESRRSPDREASAHPAG